MEGEILGQERCLQADRDFFEFLSIPGDKYRIVMMKYKIVKHREQNSRLALYTLWFHNKSFCNDAVKYHKIAQEVLHD